MTDPPHPPPAVHPTLRGGFRLRRTVVLVGLMGAGKTSVGRRLATLLRVDFIDSDHAIEEAAAMSVAEIFAAFGEADFRAGERRVIARLLSRPPCVLATGGGAFIEPATREEIAASSTSVWLRAELDLLWDRVRGRPGRPLLQAPDPRAVLRELDRRRAPIYACADVIVDSRRGASHEAMAREIVAALLAFDAAGTAPQPTLEPVV